MNRRMRVAHVVALVVIGVSALAVPAAASSPAGTLSDQSIRRATVEMLDRMPLLFVPEQVSAEETMGFAVRGRDASIWLS